MDNELNIRLVLLQRAMTWCSRREMCCHDVRTKLQKENATPEDCEYILSRLIQEQFIDELRFCRAFVHDKLNFGKWGRQKISYSLRIKRIPEESIQEALLELDPHHYLETFIPLAGAKWKSLKDSDIYLKKQKVLRFLLSKGLTMNEALTILKEIEK